MNNTLNKSMVELQKAIRNLSASKSASKDAKYVSTYSVHVHTYACNKAAVYADSLVRKY